MVVDIFGPQVGIPPPREGLRAVAALVTSALPVGAGSSSGVDLQRFAQGGMRGAVASAFWVRDSPAEAIGAGFATGTGCAKSSSSSGLETTAIQLGAAGSSSGLALCPEPRPDDAIMPGRGGRGPLPRPNIGPLGPIIAPLGPITGPLPLGPIAGILPPGPIIGPLPLGPIIGPLGPLIILPARPRPLLRPLPRIAPGGSLPSIMRGGLGPRPDTPIGGWGGGGPRPRILIAGVIDIPGLALATSRPIMARGGGHRPGILPRGGGPLGRLAIPH